MNEITPEILHDNWLLFQEVNSPAGTHPLIDHLMIFGANDLIFLLPLLLLLFWFLVARFSPFLGRMGLAGPARQPVRSLAQQLMLLGAVAVALALALNVLLGHLVYEPRPFVSHPTADHLLIKHPADASFPSDHTAVAFAIATTFVLYLLLLVAVWSPGKAKLPLAGVASSARPLVVPVLFAGIALLAAIIIGFARVYVGVHYPGDIAGGAACGFVAASFLAWLRPRLEPLLMAFIHLAERLHLA